MGVLEDKVYLVGGASTRQLLDLVEGSAELAALLGSTLECMDDRWEQPGDKLKDKIKAAGKLGSS